MWLLDKILNQSNSFKYYKNQYYQLNNYINEKNDQITILSNDINDKKNQIAILNNNLNDKKNQIAILSNENKENNIHISILNNKLKSSKTQISDLSNQIQENNYHISDLIHKIESYENHISNLNKKIKENNKFITSLNGKLEENKIYADEYGFSVLNKRLDRIYDALEITNVLEVNIAYILRAFPIHSETFIVNEIRWLKEKGHNVVIFCSSQSPKFIDIGFDVEIIMFKDKWELEQLLVDYEIDFAHTHFVYPTCTNFTHPVCEKLKIPFTVFAHAYDIFVKKNSKINNVDKISKSKYCQGIYTLSEFHKNFLIEHNVDSEKIIITKQATDYQISDLLPNNRKIKNIISLSRFVEKKGLDVLIDAAKLLENENFEFSIYGYGELENSLQSKITDLNCSNISIKGELLPSDVEKVLKESDLLVSPCKMAKNGDIDGFPTVIFESMAAGLPVLTTSISAIPEIIKDSQNGFIVPPNDPENLAQKILEISNLSNEKIFEIRKNAQNDVMNISSTDRTMQKFMGLIEKKFKYNNLD